MKLNEVAEILKIRGNSSDMISNKHDIVLKIKGDKEDTGMFGVCATTEMLGSKYAIVRCFTTNHVEYVYGYLCELDYTPFIKRGKLDTNKLMELEIGEVTEMVIG